MTAALQFAAHVAAGLVLVAGIGKLVRPTLMRDAIRLRMPAATWLVRGIGAGEVALSLAVLLLGGRALFALLAGTYLAFTVVASLQARSGRSCGCFTGSSDAIGWSHLATNVVAAGVAAAAAVAHAPGLGTLLPIGMVSATATLAVFALAVVLARSLLTDLSEVLAARSTVLGGSHP